MVRSVRRRGALALAAAAVVSTAATMSTASAAPRDLTGTHKNTVSLQLLAFNDYHGHLEPDPGGASLVPVGDSVVTTNGAAYLATHLQRLRKGRQHSLTVAAGDLIGASTYPSAIFHDEPAIETLDLMGLDVSGVGNHEFDAGVAELRRISRGGCHPVDGCFQQDAAGNDIRYPGAGFRYLAANVVNGSGRTVLPPTWVKKVGGVKVGFIGMTFENSDTLLAPTAIAGYRFRDEVRAGNQAARALQKRGVKAIVVLLHEGGFQTGSFDGCTGISGPIVDIANRLSPKIDAVVTGHTHVPYVCTMDDPRGQPRKVTSAMSYGRIITEINLPIDTRTGDVVRPRVRAENHLVTRDVRRNPAVHAAVTKWVDKATVIGNRIVATIGADIRRDPSDVESSLPNLVADAQKASTGADIAVMNPGALEAHLLVNRSRAGEPPGHVTFREAYNVQPHSNVLQTFDMTGAQIERLLEQQWVSGRSVGEVLRLGVSEGFTYSWSQSAPNGNKVDPASITLNGVTINPSASYRVTANNFIANGGIGYSAIVNGTPRTDGSIDLDALIGYLAANPGIGAPPAARSTATP